MATAFSTALDVHFSGHVSDTKRPIIFKSPSRQHKLRRSTISCSSSNSPPNGSPNLTQQNEKNRSLSEQLKPLSTTTLPKATENQAQLLSKPKSIWVNPTKPRRSVLALQRQKRATYSYNPQEKDLRRFAQWLNERYQSEAAFLAALEEIPHPPTRDNALLVLNGLKPWQKAYSFLKWIKSRDLFPLETVFYNVTMKSLKFGSQFQLMEDLANEMIRDNVELDNITYSTLISCAKKCSRFDKAVEWFDRMYKTGLMPDEVTYSAILDVYARMGKVEEALNLYERGRASGWEPDHVTFTVLGKMFGDSGDYDGIRYVLEEMKSLGVQPDLVMYNNLLEAMGKAGKPGLARSLFEELLNSGLTPNEKTLTALVKIYGKARWARDALELWEEIRSNGWPTDLILNNTLLNMCAELGLEEEAEKLFEVMNKPDSRSYTAMLNIYGRLGRVDKAMKLFEEMRSSGVGLDVMGCTCLIHCLGKAKRMDDLVAVFDVAIERGIKPDDRFCGCLLSVASLCEANEDVDKVLSCLQLANPKLSAFVGLITEEKTGFETVKNEFRSILSETAVDARRPFCNCLIDICRRKLHERAHELLYLGTVYGLYPGLHKKSGHEWCLDVRSLSVGAALTALEEWMGTLSKIVQRQEALPAIFSAQTGTGTHTYAHGLANPFASHVKKLDAPFRQSEEKVGCFVATREEIVSWVESQIASPAATA